MNAEGKRTLKREDSEVNVAALLKRVEKIVRETCESFAYQPITTDLIVVLTETVRKNVLLKLLALGAKRVPTIVPRNISTDDDILAEMVRFEVDHRHPDTGELLEGDDLDEFLDLPRIFDVTVPKEALDDVKETLDEMGVDYEVVTPTEEKVTDEKD